MSFSSFITINKLSIVGLTMRLLHLQNQYLYEGLDRESRNTVMLWESAGIKLREAQLTADQIQQIFAAVEKGATDSGSNRTMLGKGKDAASAVNKAWEELKLKVQDSKPIKNIDAAFDQAVAKIETGLGGPDNKVNQVIQKYRKFAKERPISQSLIYAALIAAAGISGAGLGAVAVLGLLKMTDKLLQGEKFSSAAYSGAKTAAIGAVASGVGDAVGGGDAAPSTGQDQSYAGQGTTTDVTGSSQSGTPQGVTGEQIRSHPAYQAEIEKWGNNVEGRRAASLAARAAMVRGESVVFQTKTLSEGQVYLVFNRVCVTNDRLLAEGVLREGPMDFFKGAAAKGMQKLQGVGKNLTTKVTADKLNSEWRKAGAPTDSEELKSFLQSQGVDQTVVDTVYSSLKIKSQPVKSAAGAAQSAATQTLYAQLKKDVMGLNKKEKQRIFAYLQKQLGTV
jgi:hypothetical protein